MQLFGPENIQFKFDLYFHWYNIIHELGHCLLSMKNKYIDPVDEEMLVNAFAVAYWKHVGSSDNLKKLSAMLRSCLKNVPNPIPEGMEFATRLFFFDLSFFTLDFTGSKNRLKTVLIIDF